MLSNGEMKLASVPQVLCLLKKSNCAACGGCAGAELQEPVPMLHVVLREHLQKKNQKKTTKNTLLKYSVLSGNQDFGSYLNLRAVVQRGNCSAHVVTSLFL